MKKVLFLTFLLFLIGLGAASVKAQVRIGGNTAPNASAVLDLNADDTNSGTKGLALPRVALTSNQMLLPGVTQNLTGMMVYNTSTTGTGVNRIGIYIWNGATWVQASLPSTSAADSGKMLISNGVNWVPAFLNHDIGTVASVNVSATPAPVTWTNLLSTNLTLPAFQHGSVLRVTAPGILHTDVCLADSYGILALTWTDRIDLFPSWSSPVPAGTFLHCYRPSL